MTVEELAQILALGHETRGVEFKGPGPLSNRRLAAQVVRAVLGMANRRDGGLVIIGVEDNNSTLNPVGLNSSDLVTWNYDDVADRIAVYADPNVEFEIETKEYTGNQYVVIQVEEFSDVPVLCKRDYPNVLRQGACYVRSRRKPETSEIPTSADMRDLMELAIDKGVIQYLDRAQRLGLIVLPDITPPSTEQFERQRGDLNE